jgi:hypothetical protein
MNNILMLLLVMLGVGATALSFANQKLSFDKELVQNSNNIETLVIDSGAGSLTVIGANVDEVSVQATIYSSKYDDLEELQGVFQDDMILTLASKGSKIVLVSKQAKKLFSNPNIAIDLTVTIPNHLNLTIDDGSGLMKIDNILGSVEIDDGSGAMTISNIGSDLKIDDGSGSLDIQNVAGDVFVDDGSGSITIQSVTGNVTIDDGSGSINVSELSGKFKLIDGGSGHIVVNGKNWKEKD